MGKSEVTCDCEVIHQEMVEKIKSDFINEDLVSQLSVFYKIFGDSTRFKILYALDKGKLCVCDISALLNMSISAVSHQLKILRENDLVKTERQGKVVYYFLSDEHVQKIIECGIEHIQEKSTRETTMPLK